MSRAFTIGGGTPYRCPVCEGRGTVRPGFYSDRSWTTSTQREQCRSCKGKGVLWQ
jgi:DnaJ-class molecular chaperone